MRVTIKDIAIRSNLSHSTVSRVLNGRANVIISEQTRKRIFDVAHDLGYQPNSIARALVTGRTNTIGLAIPAVMHPLAAEAIYSLMHAAEADNYEIIVTSIAGAGGPSVTKLPVDGILFFNTTIPDFCMSPKVDKPFVAVGTGCPTNLDHVEVDLYDAAVEAVNHLIKRSCRRIAYLTMEMLTVPGDSRTNAYKYAIAQAGLRDEYIFQPYNALPTVQSAEAFASVWKYIDEYGCPDAIFCRNDHMAVGAHHALRQFGCRIPEDVALVGCDGVDAARYLDPPLTTIQQPIDEMCKTGWRLLKQRMDDPQIAHQSVLLRPSLKIRKSSLK